MNALEVTGLSVEAGGMNVVEGLDLLLTSGDKVGMVGRNGAGKTSTLKVLAGEMPAAAGAVRRHGAVGYLRQDPRQHRADAGTSGTEYTRVAPGAGRAAASASAPRGAWSTSSEGWRRPASSSRNTRRRSTSLASGVSRRSTNAAAGSG